MKKFKDYTIEDRIVNLESLITLFFIEITLIIVFYKFSNVLFVSLPLIALIMLIMGVLVVKVQTTSYFVGEHWENALTNFYKTHIKWINFIVKWFVILTGLLITKILLKYDWGKFFGTIILTIILNYSPKLLGRNNNFEYKP